MVNGQRCTKRGGGSKGGAAVHSEKRVHQEGGGTKIGSGIKQRCTAPIGTDIRTPIEAANTDRDSRTAVH